MNTASRMENTGESGRIQITEAVERALRDVRQTTPGSLAPLVVVERGLVEVKGKGPMRTY